MQTVSAPFTTATQARVRKLKATASIAFTKSKSTATRYFTVGVSSVGGPDPIAPPANANAITEWDKYPYTDYSSRILSIEATHEQDITGALIMGMADVELVNTDDKFTPGVDGTIGAYVQSPRRPLRLNAGFGVETVPLFVGVTEKAPQLSESKKTAKFHAIDFIKTISEVVITSAVMYQDKRIDEAISSLLTTFGGLSTSQFVLEPGMRKVPFIYFKKDTKLGEAIRLLCESELATFFEDEAGILRLWNRQHGASASSVWTFNRDNCREISYPDVKNVINSVEIFGNVRAVQANQKLWELASALKIPAGSSVDLFIDYKDDFGDLPVVSQDTPAYLSSATTSYYATNEKQDGTGDPRNTYISITAFNKFATGAKITFANSHPTQEIYITAMEVFAKPAKVINQVYTLVQNTSSIAQYEEQYKKIENDYIQDEAFAKSLANMLINDRAQPSGVREIEVTRGVPQLQCGDLVTFNDGNTTATYYVIKKTTSVGKGGLVQNLTLVQRTIKKYFTVGISSIGGTDIIAP